MYAILHLSCNVQQDVFFVLWKYLLQVAPFVMCFCHVYEGRVLIVHTHNNQVGGGVVWCKNGGDSECENQTTTNIKHKSE